MGETLGEEAMVDHASTTARTRPLRNVSLRVRVGQIRTQQMTTFGLTFCPENLHQTVVGIVTPEVVVVLADHRLRSVAHDLLHHYRALSAHEQPAARAVAEDVRVDDLAHTGINRQRADHLTHAGDCQPFPFPRAPIPTQANEDWIVVIAASERPQTVVHLVGDRHVALVGSATDAHVMTATDAAK